MSTENVIKRSDFSKEVIVLRSVYGKVGMKYYIQPCKDKYGRLPDCVKPVDSNGDMRLSDKEKNDPEARYFIREVDVIEVQDGSTFDLSDPYQRNKWEAIKNCPLIAPSRFAKNEKGDYLIDGTANKNSRQQRYGVAELYVDMPGVETAQKVSRKRKIHNACAHIYNDERGAEGRLIMARLLGKPMRNVPDSDVEDYLLGIAEKDPDKIINLYTGDDIALRILFADARDRKVILVKNKLYVYGDNVILGATDEAVITWMKEQKNKKVLELIRRDTYPEMEPKTENK